MKSRMKNLAAASDYLKKNKTLNKAIYVSVEIEKEEDPRYKVIYRTLHDY